MTHPAHDTYSDAANDAAATLLRHLARMAAAGLSDKDQIEALALAVTTRTKTDQWDEAVEMARLGKFG